MFEIEAGMEVDDDGTVWMSVDGCWEKLGFTCDRRQLHELRDREMRSRHERMVPR